jgi:integration host factor subunit beta
MTRSELTTLISQRFPQLVRKDAEMAVAEILGAISQSLIQRGRVEVRGFGTFAINHRPPRIGHNPKSMEKLSVPAKWVPHFKAGKELRDAVQRDFKA